MEDILSGNDPPPPTLFSPTGLHSSLTPLSLWQNTGKEKGKKRNKKYVKRVDFNYMSGWEMLDLHILWLKNK